VSAPCDGTTGPGRIRSGERVSQALGSTSRSASDTRPLATVGGRTLIGPKT
jgi:hypothetical protein